MKRTLSPIQPTPYVIVGRQSRGTLKTLTSRLPSLNLPGSPVSLCKEVADAARASAMLVEEADERMTKPWYRVLPIDTAKR